jgi:hypothetical protein
MCNGKLLRTLQLLLLFVLFNLSLYSQIKWDGDAGDGQWMTAQNWTGDVLPAATDEVVLDNAFINASYTVTLPSGNVSVQVKSVNISALAGNIIQLILPVTNTAVPAFKVAGAVYGMVIGNGCVFKNSSGAASGEPVEISDSLMINNGGRYIQNTRRSHAVTVTVLSKSPGTEDGIFEFDIPAASNTISLSGRTYGKLLFSSNAMNGSVTYTATGINRVTVRSDLEIESGVKFSLNISDTLSIARDLIQHGGTINLANSTRFLVAAIGRHFIQSASAVIEKTGSVAPEIMFNGTSSQQIDCKGIIKDSISVKMNNAAGATLLSPLSLPYKLYLVQGAITTTASNMLTLLTGCSVWADSLSGNSFVNGPLRKENISGAAHFLFPVGKENAMGWLALKNVTGNFTVEYFKSNPKQISSVYGSGINHISNLEYWTVQADASPLPSTNLELSFSDLNSGLGADLSNYRVARLTSNVWLNAGNTAVTGTAGNRGSIVSNNITDLMAAPEYFTLGTSVAADAPLALITDTVPNNRRISGNRPSYLQLLYMTSSPLPVLACRAVEKARVTFYITSITGQLVKTITTTLERGTNSLPVPMPSLATGVYSIRAFTDNGLPSNMIRFVKGIN